MRSGDRREAGAHARERAVEEPTPTPAASRGPA
jgi:hypothetical protein